MIRYDFLRPSQLTDEYVADFRALYEELSPGAPSPTHDTLTRSCIENWLIVAVDESVERKPIVGMAILFVMAKGNCVRGRVEDVVRHPSYKGRGIGSGLMRMVHETADAEGVKRIILSSRPHREEAHKLYLAIGYKPYATDVFSFDLTQR